MWSSLNRETKTKFHWLIPLTVILRAKFKFSTLTMLFISPSVYQEEIIAWISRLVNSLVQKSYLSRINVKIMAKDSQPTLFQQVLQWNRGLFLPSFLPSSSFLPSETIQRSLSRQNFCSLQTLQKKRGKKWGTKEIRENIFMSSKWFI